MISLLTFSSEKASDTFLKILTRVKARFSRKIRSEEIDSFLKHDNSIHQLS